MSGNWIDRLNRTPTGRRELERQRAVVEVTELISRLMESNDVSKAELARRIDRPASFVTKILRGSNNFTVSTLSDVFSALGHSIHFYCGQVGDELKVWSSDAQISFAAEPQNWRSTERFTMTLVGDVTDEDKPSDDLPPNFSIAA